MTAVLGIVCQEGILFATDSYRQYHRHDGVIEDLFDVEKVVSLPCVMVSAAGFTFLHCKQYGELLSVHKLVAADIVARMKKKEKFSPDRSENYIRDILRVIRYHNEDAKLAVIMGFPSAKKPFLYAVVTDGDSVGSEVDESCIAIGSAQIYIWAHLTPNRLPPDYAERKARAGEPPPFINDLPTR